jgi:hypothetical protein
MSWDIIVMDLPPGLKSVAELPKDFKPRPLGQRSDLIKKISAIFPNIDFSDPSWGILKADGCYIEFSMGPHDEVKDFGLHVRGGDECPNVVAHPSRRARYASNRHIVGLWAVRARPRPSLRLVQPLARL